MTVAADRANATLLPHPALAFLGSDADGHSLAPVCPGSSPLRILTDQQRAELDERGWTVLEGAFTTCTIDGLRVEVDRLEAELNPPDGPGLALGDAENVAVVDSGRLRTPSGATIRNISDARHITFSSRLADRSAAIRAFCGSEVFQRLAHDTLGARSVRLYNDEAVYKKPSGGGRGRSFPFHQDSGYMCTWPLQYLTCWTALNDVTRKTGCPWFLPAVHKLGPLAHDFDEANRGWTIPGLRADDAVCVPLRAGSMAVFWSHTPHMTGPNETDSVRKGFIVQLTPDGARQVWDKYEHRPVDRALVSADEEQSRFLVLQDGNAPCMNRHPRL